MEEMYQQYAKPVYYFLLSLSHSPEIAEELTAETFYQAIRSIHRYDGSCQLKTWLFQIAKHLWLKQSSRMKRETSTLYQDISNKSAYDFLDQVMDATEEKI